MNSSERLILHMDEWIGSHVLISAFGALLFVFFLGMVEILNHSSEKILLLMGKIYYCYCWR